MEKGKTLVAQSRYCYDTNSNISINTKGTKRKIISVRLIWDGQYGYQSNDTNMNTEKNEEIYKGNMYKK